MRLEDLVKLKFALKREGFGLIARFDRDDMRTVIIWNINKKEVLA